MFRAPREAPQERSRRERAARPARLRSFAGFRERPVRRRGLGGVGLGLGLGQTGRQRQTAPALRAWPVARGLRPEPSAPRRSRSSPALRGRWARRAWTRAWLWLAWG